MRQTRLEWFGHAERMDKENRVNNCRFIEVGDQRGKGRPGKTWTELVNGDLKKLRCSQDRKSTGLEINHQKKPIQPMLAWKRM